jgi:hypothetical protein
MKWSLCVNSGRSAVGMLKVLSGDTKIKIQYLPENRMTLPHRLQLAE